MIHSYNPSNKPPLISQNLKEPCPNKNWQQARTVNVVNSKNDQPKPACCLLLGGLILHVAAAAIAIGLGILAIVAGFGITLSAIVVTGALIIPIGVALSVISCCCCCGLRKDF